MWLILIESFLIESDLDFLDFLDCGLLKGCLEVEKRGSVIKAPHDLRKVASRSKTVTWTLKKVPIS